MPPSRTKSKHHSSASPLSSDDSPSTVKKDGKDLKDDKLKRKRQSQSCDACRARKVRCARPDSADGELDESTGGMTIATTMGPDGKKEVAQCKHCIALGIKCTYDYQPKKRGPPNLYLRRLQEAAAAQQGAHEISASPTGLVSPTSALTLNHATPSPIGSMGFGLSSGGGTPMVPSHRNSDPKSQNNGYFVNGATNGQMVVPSQAYHQSPQQQHQQQQNGFSNSSNGYHQTHSFMDTNTVPSGSSASTGGAGSNGLPNLPTLPTLPALPTLPSLSMPTLPNLQSLSSMPLWQHNSSMGGDNNGMNGLVMHGSNGQSYGQSQSMHGGMAPQILATPMHLQPSPARLSPVSGTLNLSQQHQNHNGMNSMNGSSNSHIPPSRYPIAADLNGIARPSSGGAADKASANEMKSPSAHIDPSKNIIGQRYVHHYTSTSGSLPPFVHSRAGTPVEGQSSNHRDPMSLEPNGHTSSSMSSNLMQGDGNQIVPLTPTIAAEIFPQYPMYNWSMPYKPIEHQSHPSPDTSSDMFGGGVASANASLAALTSSSNNIASSSSASSSTLAASAPIHPPLAGFHRPHCLETLAPRTTIMHILSLFFDFVYPLTPCVHKPSFYQGLLEKREERDPLFFALVCSTVAATLVQVPRSYLPMERDEVRKMAKRFSEASRLVTVASYDPPCSAMVVIRYFDTVYHFCEGHDATSHAGFGEAAHIAVTLHMHEEASYEGLDYIESEIRRRTFWLLFDADKSMSILLGRPVCLRDEDCTLHFPREVDDEYITQHSIQPQPPGKTAIVSGLNYISRIFALLGEILVRIRVDKRCPPQGQFAIARLEEVRALHTRICSALSHCPPELRLKSVNPANGGVGSSSASSSASSTAGSIASTDSGTRTEFGGAGFTKNTFAEIKEFFDNPNASRENASNPFLVMQANLYVTQQLVRFVIEQYRDELVTSMRESGVDFSAHGSVAAELARGNWTSDDREAVASDLLNVLHSIPIQSIATNGPSLVHKVRFVASTLLDAVRKAETAPASAARAHAFLWDFLSILSEIERNYLLADDREEFDA